MISNLKLGWKMMRYAYGIKSNCIQAGIFALMGLVIALTGSGGNFGALGGFFWICISILPSQMIYSLSMSNMVQASPMKKRMQTAVPVLVNLASMLLIYLLEILLCGIQYRIAPRQQISAGQTMVMLAVMMALLMLYVGVCYKHFLVPTLLMVSVMVIWMRGGMEGWMDFLPFSGNGADAFVLGALTGAGILLAGALAEYLLTLLLYKRPMAKMAQAVPLRR